MEHHLQALYDNNVELVIDISDSKFRSLNGGNMFNGFKVSKEMLSRVEINHELSKESWDLTKERDKTKEVIYYRFKGWDVSKEFSEITVQGVLTAITHLRREMGTTRDSITLLVYDDLGGISGAAVLVSLMHLLEEIDDALLASKSEVGKSASDSMTINIFETVDNLRCKRMGMIRNIEEYTFLHQSVMYYANHKEQYDDLLKEESTEQPSHSTYVNDEDPIANLNVTEDEYVLYDDDGNNVY